MKNSGLKWEVLCLGLLALLLVPVLWAFAKPGFFTTHDGGYHVLRLAHYHQEVLAGQFPVRLVPALAKGYGYSPFNYFYPLPYMISLVFVMMGFPYGESLKILGVLTTIGSIYFCYAWLRGHFDHWPALAGTIIFLFVPYRFLTLYVTGQLGGLMAFLWLPLLLLSIDQVIIRRRFLFVVPAAIAIAGFIASHVISVLACLPLLATYTEAVLWKTTRNAQSSAQHRLQPLMVMLIAGVLGAGMSAFYWLPAKLEGKYVKMGHEVLVQYQDHWPTLRQLIYSPWGYGYSQTGSADGMSFQVGLAQWGVFGLSVLILAGLIWMSGQRKKLMTNQLLLPLTMVVITAVTIFLMLPISGFLWEIFPPLQYLQYAWRLLVVTMMTSAFLATWLSSLKWGKFVMVLIILLAFFNNRNYLRAWESARYTDDYYLQNEEQLYGSTDISWEVLPVQAPAPPAEHAKSLVRVPEVVVPPQPVAHHRFSLDIQENQRVILNLLYSPNWAVTANGQPVEATPTAEGLVSFSLPAGQYQMAVDVKNTRTQNISHAISAASFAALILFAVWLWIIRTKGIWSK